MKRKQRFLSLLLALFLCAGMLPMSALAADGPQVIEKEADSWAALKTAVSEFSGDDILKVSVTGDLQADSRLDISGETVVLSVATGPVSITRTLPSASNSVDPVFKLSGGASLTIDGGENGITLLDSNVNRSKSRGLIYADTGTTLKLSNVSFTGLRFGRSLATTGYGAVYANAADVTMDNVTITDCVGGDGVLIYGNNSTIRMNGCTASNTTYYGNQNQTGGVVRIKGSSSNVTMDRCRIENCGSAEANGAANSRGPVWLNGGTVTVSNSTINGNTAMIGAGIMADRTDLTLTNVDVTNNTSRGDGYDPTTGEPNSSKGNVTWWQGAGLYIENCTLSMSKVNITGNTGSFIGGGMYITGTDLTMDSTVTISGNSAVCGGGFYTDDSRHTITLNGAKIINNTAVKKDAYKRFPLYNGCGAGIANDEGNVVLENAEVSGNIAAVHGGGIISFGTTSISGGSVTGNSADSTTGCGGGICIVSGKVHTEGSTAISGNTAGSGNGIYVCAGTTFEIQDSVVIDQGNDVALEGADAANNIPAAYITVSAPFTGASTANPINISSQDTDVENPGAEPPAGGTPLVLYTDAAGGAQAALTADYDELFVPSRYMQTGLLIGHSQIDGSQQWLTYVAERVLPSFDVTYKDSGTKQDTTDQLSYGTQIAVDPNGGTLDWSNSAWDNSRNGEKQILSIKENTIIPDPSWDSHTFTGWERTVENDILTFTAQWQSSGGDIPVGITYKLTYVSNGGTEYSDERYAPNTNVSLNKVPVREGYQFTGWYADRELTQRIREIRMTSDKTVYAGWTETKVPALLNGEDHFAYVMGYPDGSIGPMNNITRAEVAAIFFRLLKDEVRDGSLTYTGSFADVDSSAWYSTSVCTMARLGILKGRTDTSFAPDAPITRGEFAAICARFDSSLTSGGSGLTDISGHWAESEIRRAAALGWVQGDPDGSFRPDAYITRAEAMTIINRVLCRMPETEGDLLSGMNVWYDNLPGQWYYLAVQEASNSHCFERRGEVFETWTALTEHPDWSRYE